MGVELQIKIVRYRIFKCSTVGYCSSVGGNVIPFTGSVGDRRVPGRSCDGAWNANFMNVIHA